MRVRMGQRRGKVKNTRRQPILMKLDAPITGHLDIRGLGGYFTLGFQEEAPFITIMAIMAG